MKTGDFLARLTIARVEQGASIGEAIEEAVDAYNEICEILKETQDSDGDEQSTREENGGETWYPEDVFNNKDVWQSIIRQVAEDYPEVNWVARQPFGRWHGWKDCPEIDPGFEDRGEYWSTEEGISQDFGYLSFVPFEPINWKDTLVRVNENLAPQWKTEMAHTVRDRHYHWINYIARQPSGMWMGYEACPRASHGIVSGWQPRGGRTMAISDVMFHDAPENWYDTLIDIDLVV